MLTSRSSKLLFHGKIIIQAWLTFQQSPYISQFWNIFRRQAFLMSQLKELEQLLVYFRDERDWKQFHNPKDLATALSIEAGELLEAFLWKSADDAKIEKVKEELADGLAYAILLGHHDNLDLEQVVREKVQKNGEKYPVEKAKGSATKYNEL